MLPPQTPELPLPALIPPVYESAPDLSHGKNIVICADGTGNADVKGRGSNVFKTFEAIDTTSHLHDINLPRQVAFYDEGVGTESLLPVRVLGAGFGVGLKDNICELYREIARVYDPADRIYLFGFSRGAFTVRMLAGMLDCCGVLQGATYPTRAALRADVRRCFDHYVHGRDAKTFPSNLKRHPKASIEFIGVWDTVDAVGFSFKGVADWWNDNVVRYKREVNDLPASVRYACQALALDEERKAFSPELWRHSERVEQVWFAGVHSDIGGGYPRQGLSLIALHWIMKRAEARGLRFVASDLTYYDDHQIGSDKLHDSRAGAGLLYRWKPRNVVHLCHEAGVAPHVHNTAFDRIAQGVEGYAPFNIPLNPVVNFTERRDWRYIDPSQLQDVLSKYATDLTQAAEKGSSIISIGVTSYVLFLAAIAVALLAVGSAVKVLLQGGVSALLAILAVDIRIMAVSVVLGATSLLLAKITDTRIDRLFSGVWHRVRADLRKALTRHDVVLAVPSTPAGVNVAVDGVCSPPY